MGRHIKNSELKSRSYAIRMPIGSSGTPIAQAQAPVDGQMYFNTASNNIEVYRNGSWQGIGLVGRVAIVTDSHFGTGSAQTFAMTNTYLTGREAEILVFVGGVYQTPNVAYTVNGYDITFTSAPNLGLPIIILHNFNSTDAQ